MAKDIYEWTSNRPLLRTEMQVLVILAKFADVQVNRLTETSFKDKMEYACFRDNKHLTSYQEPKSDVQKILSYQEAIEFFKKRINEKLGSG